MAIKAPKTARQTGLNHFSALAKDPNFLRLLMN